MNTPVEWLEDQFNSTYEWMITLSRQSRGERVILVNDHLVTEYITHFRPILHVDWIGPTTLFTIKEDA